MTGKIGYSKKQLWPLPDKMLLKTREENPENSRPMLLDAGCKTGGFCDFASGLGFDPVGVDAESGSVESAKKTFLKIVFYNANSYDFKEASLYGKCYEK